MKNKFIKIFKDKTYQITYQMEYTGTTMTLSRVKNMPPIIGDTEFTMGSIWKIIAYTETPEEK